MFYLMQEYFYHRTHDKLFLLIYLLAIEVGVSSEWASRASEGEHGEGDGDGHVHANLYKMHAHMIKHNYCRGTNKPGIKV